MLKVVQPNNRLKCLDKQFASNKLFTMDSTSTPKEDPLTYKHVKILRVFLYTVGGWPGEALGEKMPLLIRFHRIYIAVQASISLFGQIFYIIKRWNKMTFLLKGYCVVIVFMCIVTIIRGCLLGLKNYGETLKEFFKTFHLGHFRHKGKYYQEVYTVMDEASYYFTLYMMSMMVVGMTLFNSSPFYQNYTNGAFSGKLLPNATVEFTVYYAYPGFEPEDHFFLVTTINLHASYCCSIYVCSIDLLLSVMVFQIIGHILILRKNLSTLPRPKADVEGVKNFGLQMTVAKEMYDAEENRMIHEKLVEYISHHRTIVAFTRKMTEFFGPLLGINYAFHLVCCCLLLLECSQGGPDALVRLGPLTFIIFGELIQISVIFEIVGTVSEKLTEVVYDTPWECMNTRNRRSVCILLHRVQTPITVTAGLCTVGVNTMAAILRTTFSYYAMLQSLHE